MNTAGLILVVLAIICYTVVDMKLADGRDLSDPANTELERQPNQICWIRGRRSICVINCQAELKSGEPRIMLAWILGSLDLSFYLTVNRHRAVRRGAGDCRIEWSA